MKNQVLDSEDCGILPEFTWFMLVIKFLNYTVFVYYDVWCCVETGVGDGIFWNEKIDRFKGEQFPKLQVLK